MSNKVRRKINSLINKILILFLFCFSIVFADGDFDVSLISILPIEDQSIQEGDTLEIPIFVHGFELIENYEYQFLTDNDCSIIDSVDIVSNDNSTGEFTQTLIPVGDGFGFCNINITFEFWEVDSDSNQVLTSYFLAIIPENNPPNIISTPDSTATEDIEWMKIMEQGYKINTILVDFVERSVDTIDDYNYLSNKYM